MSHKNWCPCPNCHDGAGVVAAVLVVAATAAAVALVCADAVWVAVILAVSAAGTFGLVRLLLRHTVVVWRPVVQRTPRDRPREVAAVERLPLASGWQALAASSERLAIAAPAVTADGMAPDTSPPHV